MSAETGHRDVVVIGSGFGGALAAWPLVRRGLDVLMLERGDWIERGPECWEPDSTLTRTRHYADGQLRVRSGGRERAEGTTACVGGASVFYGAVSTRFREEDFRPDPAVTGDPGARWPLGYDELRPRYLEAERILGVAGVDDGDPTAPPRRADYPQSVPELSPTSRMIAEAASRLGLRPHRLPLAINYGIADRRPDCVRCDTCDTFACAIGAKNDLASRVLPRLLEAGLELRPRTAVVALEAESGSVRAVRARDTATGEELRFTADRFVLAAGALGTPQLLAASGLRAANPAGHAVGRRLMRHCASIVFGGYPRLPDDGGTFHKQVGINDYYLGDDEAEAPEGKLGNIQQVQSPSPGPVRAELPRPLPALLSPVLRRSTGLLVLAEDRPAYGNHVALSPDERDPFGLPRTVVRHSHDDRDRAARTALARRARQIHREAGALLTYEHRIDTFSHALGTVRMGEDPEADPVAPDGRYRGLDNLRITDASVFPTAAGVNPSLTIAANALRIGRIMAGLDPEAEPEEAAAGAEPSGAPAAGVSTTGTRPAAADPDLAPGGRP